MCVSAPLQPVAGGPPYHPAHRSVLLHSPLVRRRPTKRPQRRTGQASAHAQEVFDQCPGSEFSSDFGPSSAGKRGPGRGNRCSESDAAISGALVVPSLDHVHHLPRAHRPRVSIKFASGAFVETSLSIFRLFPNAFAHSRNIPLACFSPDPKSVHTLPTYPSCMVMSSARVLSAKPIFNAVRNTNNRINWTHQDAGDMVLTIIPIP